MFEDDPYQDFQSYAEEDWESLLDADAGLDEPVGPIGGSEGFSAFSSGAELQIFPSEFTEYALHLPHRGAIRKFSFEGRRYMRKIYDSPASRKIVCAGRQVEKSVVVSSTYVSILSGQLVPIADLRCGQAVVSLAQDGAGISTGTVAWISKRYRKPCLRIRTRQGHVVEVATTHPMRTWDAWTEAAQLTTGTRLAVVRRSGEFLDKRVAPCRVELTAYMIADGSLGAPGVSITKSDGPVQDDLLRCLEQLGVRHTRNKRVGKAPDFRLRKSELTDWLHDDGLLGCLSAEKFIPGWVFDLSRNDTARFLNRLWACDGHVRKTASTKYDLVYSSISERLVRQVQALLWKFGIPTRYLRYVPSVYEGTGEAHHMIRVETQAGVRCFLQEIGALGKSEGVTVPSGTESNNRDTYPMEVNDLIRRIVRSHPQHTGRSNDPVSLHRAGLRQTLKYAPSKDKLSRYVEFFRSEPGFDQQLVSRLAAHVETDLFWDEIEEIEEIGEQECVDLMVDQHHNFVANGFVTHNSTLLGNIMLANSILTIGFKSLYVSPSHMQTKKFSNDRLAEPIRLSPILTAYAGSSRTPNMLEKRFANHSSITLRYAYQNADRARGIQTDLLNVDEFQDILLDNVPVLEECASHSEYKIFLYSGTPKTLDNAIEHYWSKYSTQNEWVVPCRRHGTPKDRSSWHWNVLTAKNIGRHGLVCDRCGSPVNADDPDSTWAAMNPTPAVTQRFEGYRIPQLMVPWIDWAGIVHKYENYPTAQMHNEVLGLSYDSGTRPLSNTEVMRCCNADLSMERFADIQSRYGANVQFFAGIDWGSAERSSYTVIVLGAYLPFDPDQFTIFYARRFSGPDADPKVQLEKIHRLINIFRVSHVGVDYGGGHWPNDELVRTYGAERVHRYSYEGALRKKIQYDGKLGTPRYQIHRTEIMSDVFNAIKRGTVFRFPRWEEWQVPFGEDMTNIFAEYNNRMRQIMYKRGAGKPDDTFHAIVFCFLASFHFRPRTDIIVPVAPNKPAEVLNYADEGPESTGG